MRRDWQQRHGALVNPLRYEPDEAILVNRAQNADVLMIGVKIAWELKLAGDAEAWDFLAASALVDVTRTFEIKAQADFRTPAENNGEASPRRLRQSFRRQPHEAARQAHHSPDACWTKAAI